jgi:hypothetical protein
LIFEVGRGRGLKRGGGKSYWLSVIGYRGRGRGVKRGDGEGAEDHTDKGNYDLWVGKRRNLGF